MKTTQIITLISLLIFGSLNAQENKDEDSTKIGIRKNSIYIEAIGVGIVGSINYDRIIPISNKTGIVLRYGINYKGYPIGEVDAFIGGPINFFEFGYGGILWQTWHYLVRIGYHYQGPKGLLIKPAYFYGNSIENLFGGSGDTGSWFGLSLGYSF